MPPARIDSKSPFAHGTFFILDRNLRNRRHQHGHYYPTQHQRIISAPYCTTTLTAVGTEIDPDAPVTVTTEVPAVVRGIVVPPPTLPPPPPPPAMIPLERAAKSTSTPSVQPREIAH